MKFIYWLSALLISTSVYANCDRYYIVYIENQTDKEIDLTIGDQDLTLNIEFLKTVQQRDLKNIFANARSSVADKCRFLINGADLVPDAKGISRLSRIYTSIMNDGQNSPVDVFSLTHGSTSGEIEVLAATDKSEMSTAEEALFSSIPYNLRKRLGIFVNTACYGLSTNMQAINAGFATSIGSDDQTLGPLVLREFLKGYLDGHTLKETSQDIFNACLNDEIWRKAQEIGIAEKDHEAYCKNALIAIVGDSAIDNSYTIDDLMKVRTKYSQQMKEIGSEFDNDAGNGILANDEKVKQLNSSNAFYKSINGDKKIDYTISPKHQFGNGVQTQIDIDFKDWRVFKYVQISNLNISSKGIIGGRIGLINTETLSVANIERNPIENILFHFEIIRYNQSLFVTGGNNGRGFSWKYALSTNAKVGYLITQDKFGKTAHIANIGAGLNNKLEIRYKSLVLDTDTGYNLTPFSWNYKHFYTGGTLQLEKNGNKIGGYVDYNQFNGLNVGVTATIKLQKKKKK